MRNRQMTRSQFEKRVEAIRAQLRAEVPPFEDMSPEAVGKRKKKAGRSLQFFGEIYLPHYFTHPPADWHEDFDETIASLNRQIAAVHAHRDGAKSVRATLAFVLQQHLDEERGEPFISVVSATRDLGKDFVAFIKLELEENPRIRADFGDIVGHPWSTEDLVSKNGRRILARGVGQKMRGLRWRQHRPTLTVCDDLEDDELALNPKRVKKLYKWFFSTLVPALGQSGRWRVVVVGTLIAKGCFLDKLMASADEDGKPIVVRRYPAVVKGPKGRERSSWPSRFSLKDWRGIKKTVGSIIWGAEYQGEPSDEEATIREEWLKAAYWKEGDLDGVEMEAAVQSYDPSTGKKADEGSYGGVVKLARCPQGHFWVLDAWIRRRTVKRQVQALVDMFLQGLRPFKVTVESIAFANLVMNELSREERKRGVRLPVVEVTQTKNKELRLASLGPLAERGLLHLNPNQGDQALLIEQLLGLDNPNVEDDGPDALEMANRELAGLVKAAGAGRAPTREERRPARKGSLFGAQTQDLYDPEPEPQGAENKKEVAA